MLVTLNNALEQLIKKNINISNVTISFAAPDNEFSKSVNSPTINIFLYDIRENLEMRTHKNIYMQPKTQVANTTDRYEATLAPSATYVNFSYIITEWKVGNNQEQDIMSLLLNILLPRPTLIKEFLKDSKLENIKPLPQIQILHPTYLQSLGEFWSAIGGKPKPMIHCTITAPIYPLSIPPVPLITTASSLLINKAMIGYPIKYGESFILTHSDGTIIEKDTNTASLNLKLGHFGIPLKFQPIPEIGVNNDKEVVINHNEVKICIHEGKEVVYAQDANNAIYSTDSGNLKANWKLSLLDTDTGKQQICYGDKIIIENDSITPVTQLSRVEDRVILSTNPSEDEYWIISPVGVSSVIPNTES